MLRDLPEQPEKAGASAAGEQAAHRVVCVGQSPVVVVLVIVVGVASIGRPLQTVEAK